jgi:hypothetical protein
LSANVSDDFSSVVQAEYFEGTDPGEGNGTPMTVFMGLATTNLPTNLSLGQHTFTVRAKNSFGNWTRGTLPTAVLTVTAPILSGKVTNSANTGLSGVRVDVANQANHTNIIATTTTDSSGNYSVSIPAPGTYDVIYTPSDTLHYQQLIKTGINLTVSNTLNVQLASVKHVISGTITNSNGNPVSMDLNFRSTTNSNVSVTVTSSISNGHYSAMVDAGTYYLAQITGTAQPQSGAAVIRPYNVNLLVDANSGDVTQDLQIPVGHINVTVKDGYGNLTSGATVSVHDEFALFPIVAGGDVQYVNVSTFLGTSNSSGSVALGVIATAYSPGSICANISGHVTCNSSTVTLAPNDTASVLIQAPAQTPPAPTGLTAASPTSTAPVLNWNAVSVASSYNIYRDGQKIGSVIGATFTDSSLTISGSYTYTVTSVSALSVESPASNAVTVIFSVPRPVVTNVHANPATITLGQSATLSADVTDSFASVVAAEYFEGTDPGEGNGIPMTIMLGVATATLPTNLSLGQHTFTVRAQDSIGNWTRGTLPTTQLTVTLPTLNGRVLNGANEGLSGVRVDVVDPSDHSIALYTTSTNGSGNYSLSINPGTYDVIFTPSGNVYSQTTKTNVDLTTSSTLDVVLVLAPHVFHGTLKDKNNTVISGATLSLHNQGGQTFTTTTGGNGSFSVSVNPAAYSLTISYNQLGAPTAFVPNHFTLSGGTFDLTRDVEANLVVKAVTLSLTTKSTLTNAVVGNVNLNISTSTATTLYDGSAVYSGSASYGAITDGTTGVASIVVLADSQYGVNAVPPANSGVVATQFGLEGPITADTPRDLPLDADIAHFSGAFTDNAATPAGIPGATVRLSGPLGTFQATTDSSGNFNIEAAAGSYSLSVSGSKPGGSSLRIPDSYNFMGGTADLSAGDVVQNLRLSAAQVDVRAKSAFGANLSDVTIQLSGVPASVELYPGGSFTASASSSGVTNGSGVASLVVTKGLAYGTKATPQAGSGYIVTNLAPGTVVTDDTAWDIMLSRDLKDFSGTIKDKNNLPVKGATVRLDGNEPDQHYGFTTGADGGYHLQVAPNSAYSLQVSGTKSAADPDAYVPDNFALASTINITTDTTKDVTVVAVSLDILARDDRLTPVALVGINFSSSGSQNGFAASSSNINRTTEFNGHTRLLMLANTTYTISATPPPLMGYVNTTFNGTSPITQNSEVVIEFQNHVPLAPTDLTAHSPTNTSPALQWSAVTNAHHYIIYRDGLPIDTSLTTSFADTTLTADGSYQYRVSAVSPDNYEGLKSDPIDVFYDTTPPDIGYDVTPTPNDAGWNKTDLVVTFNCSDPGGSGIASCSPPVPVSTETAGLDVPGTAVDKAGNSKTVTAHVKLDKTAPVPEPPTWTANPMARGSSTTITVSAPDPGALSGLAAGEYFIDNDPGVGNGIPMSVNGNNLSATFGSSLPAGVYKIGVRAQDAAGNWSETETDYLVVYDPAITLGVMGQSKDLVPSLANGDILPGLNAAGQTDTAEYGMGVDYKNGVLDPHNDFRFSYDTGTHCNTPSPVNCHTFELNATSFSWLLIDQTNDSRGRFQGSATVIIDGASSTHPFTVEGIDGQRLSPATSDYFVLKIYATGANPATASPIYRVSGYLNKQNAVEVR